MNEIKELKEVRFDTSEINLRDNLVRGSILPQKIAELPRNVILDGNTVVEGAIYGHRIEIRKGEVEICGAVFAQNEVYVAGDVTGSVVFRKSVGSANSVVSRAAGTRPCFGSDINARQVSLRNAFVAGSIYADEIDLENCVVIGGVFATSDASINNCIVGTFNTPQITLQGTVQLLLPSAFTIDTPTTTPDTRLYNLSLADLGALYRGVHEDTQSGRIPMNLETDEIKSNLTGEDARRTLRAFTVIGKVLAADLIDTDRFQNHFLLTAAALGPQMLKTYDLGQNADGTPATLDAPRLRQFFFDLLEGRVEPRPMDATFSLQNLPR